jgi:hypothetical protein
MELLVPQFAFITDALAIGPILILALIYATYRSGFTKDRKIALYILAIMAPVVCLIVYFIFRSYSTPQGTSRV